MELNAFNLAVIAFVLFSATGNLHAESVVSQSGACPVFHCNSEATGAMSLDLETAAHPVYWQNNQAGNLTAQGCSGDGKILACVFSKDKNGTGTLKVFHPIEKRELWGSKLSGSYNLSAGFAGVGQVPFITSTGEILASDNRFVVRYSQTGALAKSLELLGSPLSLSFGVIGLSQNLGLVNQRNGMLTAFDLSKLTFKGRLQLIAKTGSNVSLSSPVSAHENRIYAATQEEGKGLVNSSLKAIDAMNNALLQKWEYPYQGVSGASAVVVSPQISGRQYPLVLLHTPARAGASMERNELVAIEDLGSSYRRHWAIPLSGSLEVAPLINTEKKQFYVQLRDSSLLYTYDFNGTLLSFVDLRSLEPVGANWSDFKLNGHLVGTFTPDSQIVFLSGGGASGQFVMGLEPTKKALEWGTRIYSTFENYTGAWTIHARSSGNCPIVIAPSSGISVLCPGR